MRQGTTRTMLGIAALALAGLFSGCSAKQAAPRPDEKATAARPAPEERPEPAYGEWEHLFADAKAATAEPAEAPSETTPAASRAPDTAPDAPIGTLDTSAPPRGALGHGAIFPAKVAARKELPPRTVRSTRSGEGSRFTAEVIGPEAIDPPPSAPSVEEQPAAAAKPAENPAATAEQPGYTLVQVYYGTDRAPQSARQSGLPGYVGWLAFTLGSLGVTLILVPVAYRYRATRLMRGLATLSAGATLVLAVRTGYAAWCEVRPVAPAGGEVADYGGERGPLALGTCTVSVPEDHRVGHLEGPSILRLDLREDPRRHVVLMGVEPQSGDAFLAGLKGRVDRSAAKGAFVFIHGYNVNFADAARRTAQIAYDLRFDGAPIFYSWPSQGSFSGYTIDETNVEWTVPHLKQFLTEIVGRSGATEIHLIAHSMGNRALMAALRELARDPPQGRPRFREVVLTAPDIDAEIFRRDLAPAIVGTADRVTLYASSRDEALELSKEVHGYPRAGDADAADLVVVPGVDTIDVSAVDTSLVGHSYYGSNGTVLADLFDLLHENKPPDQRKWLRTQYLGALRYWIFAR